MKQNPLNEGVLTGNFTGISPVTRAMARARACELTLIAGRTALEVTLADYEQAKRELTGESDLDRQDALLDALPESKRWNVVDGSQGRQVSESPSEDGDKESRSEIEQPVDAGAEEADGIGRCLQPALPRKPDNVGRK